MGDSSSGAFDTVVNDGVGKHHRVRAAASWTVATLKKSLSIRLELSISDMRIFYGYEQLVDDTVLGDVLRRQVANRGSDSELPLTKRTPEQAQWLEKVKANPLCFTDKAPNAVRIDKDAALLACGLKGNGLNYRFVNPPLRYDKDVLRTALTEDARALQYAPERLRGDRDIVLAAVAKDGDALKYALKPVRSDRDVVLAAARNNGWALHWSDPAFTADREVVLAAVSSRGRSVVYASDELKADPEIGLAACWNDGSALELLPDALKAMPEVVLNAARQHPDALKFAAPGLRTKQLLAHAAAKAGVCKQASRWASWQQLSALHADAEEAVGWPQAAEPSVVTVMAAEDGVEPLAEAAIATVDSPGTQAAEWPAEEAMAAEGDEGLGAQAAIDEDGEGPGAQAAERPAEEAIAADGQGLCAQTAEPTAELAMAAEDGEGAAEPSAEVSMAAEDGGGPGVQETLEPIQLSRTKSAGGIPVYRGADVRVVERSPTNFEGQVPATEKLWFGATTLEIAGVRWTLDSFLNYGAEGQTYAATQQATGKKYAAKFCNKVDSAEVNLVVKLPRELVEHPNFIHYESVVLDVNSSFSPAYHIIFMEHVPNGELFDVLASPEPSVAGKPLSEGTSRRFLHDIISGMAECYRFGVTHRDLKPENLLLHEDGRIIIIDMGHAKRAPTSGPGEIPEPTPLARTTTTNPYGTPAFNAPEVSSGKTYDCEMSDVWSVGVIAFYLHGKLPAFSAGGGVASWRDVEGPENRALWHKIESSGFYPKFPDRLKTFINTMWRMDPTERPSFAQLEKAVAGDEATLAAHPGLEWLAQPNNDIDAFIGELRRSCPGKTFLLPGEEPPAAAPQKRW